MLKISGFELSQLLQAVLSRGGELKFQASGSSMSPFIKGSDWVTISPFRRSFPRLGDVVACIHPEKKKLIIHRVVGRRNGCYLIKGDRTAPIDCRARKEDIIGRVKSVERNHRKIAVGLGPERVVIAFFSRLGLIGLFGPLGRLVKILAGS